MKSRILSTTMARIALLILLALVHWDTQAQTTIKPDEQSAITPAVKPEPTPRFVKDGNGNLTEVKAEPVEAPALLPNTISPASPFNITDGPSTISTMQPRARNTEDLVDPETPVSKPEDEQR